LTLSASTAENRSKPVIAVLMTCFNRKELTLRAIGAISSAVAGAASYRVFLVDDNSSDGTSEALGSQFPDTNIIRGSGILYWNGGMRLAWLSAIPSKPDFYLWLNDDTILLPAAVAHLLKSYREYDARTIVVGRCVDPLTGVTTYGGYVRQAGVSRVSFRHLEVGEHLCDTMNGNCVLFPASVVSDIGINSPLFIHQYGDNDYGLRARRAGYRITQCNTPVAIQERNNKAAEQLGKLTLKTSKFIFTSPKGIRPDEWLYFCFAHAGPLWIVNFFWRYIKIMRIY